MKKKLKKRMNIISAVLFAVISFMLFAPLSIPFAAFMTIGALCMPFIKLPAGILGTGTAGGDVDEKAALLKMIKEQTALDVKAFLDANPEVKSFTELKTKIADLETKSKLIKTEAEYKTLTDELAAMGLEIKALKETAKKPEKSGTIAATLLANKAKIDTFLAAKSGSLMIEHKATQASTDIDGRENYFTWHEGGAVGQLPVRKPFMRELFTNVSTSTEFIKYIDQETIVRDAKNVAGCAASTHNTKVTWKTRDLKVDKVRDFVHICIDMMMDYGFVQGEIDRMLNTSLALKIDRDLLLGTGISPILHGVDEVASTFSCAAGGGYCNVIPAATIIDLISVAGAQIRAFGEQNMWMPNVVLMNPRDVQKMKLLKDNEANYIRANVFTGSLFQDRSGIYWIDGMMIIENPLVPVNELYIGDFRKGTVYARPGVGIEFSYENRENFETETVTVKVYERLNLLIRNVDANAFMHVPDICNAITSISGTEVCAS